MLKKLGVIGGMGPEATSFYYARVIARTKAESDQEHINMIILSHATMPDRTQAILTGISFRSESNHTGRKRSGDAGSGKYCDSVQYLALFPGRYPEIYKCSDHQYGRGECQICSRGSSKSEEDRDHGNRWNDAAKTYHRACEKFGITPVVPGEACQKDVMSLIYDDIKKGKPGDKNKFDRAYNDLKAKGCDAVILACTEISVFKEYYQVPADCMDAMDVLVRESIIRSGAEYRE